MKGYVTLFLLTFCLSSFAEITDDQVKEMGKELLSSMQSDKKNFGLVLSEIKKSNIEYSSVKRISKEAPKEISDLDLKWREWIKHYFSWKFNQKAIKNTPRFISRILGNNCSIVLQNIIRRYPNISEIFIINKAGVNVCVNEPTSDFDQGDEDKWAAIFIDNQNVWLGPLERDASSRLYQRQISIPIRADNGEKIATMVVGFTSK